MKQQGFTLIEVLFALLIFAITGAALMRAAADHIQGVGLIEDVTFATWVANNQLTQIHLADQWPPANNVKGEMDMAGKTWFWQQKVTKTNDDSLRAVEVIVSETQDLSAPVTSVTTFVAQTTSTSLSNQR